MLDVLCVGHASYDITMAVTSHPKADEKMLAEAMDLAGGGPAANAALCVARLEGQSGFCGYLGNDVFGQMHAEELIAAGVDISNLVRGDMPSPVSQILAKADGSRSVVNFKADTAHLPPHAVVITGYPKVMLFDGHEPLLSLPLCRLAKENGVLTLLDAGSLHQGTELIAGEVDYLVVSEKFARQYCETDDMHQALHCLSGILDKQHVVITLGERGLLWSHDGQAGVMPALAVDVVDSTGAGDAFHGAFALGLARGMGWFELLHFASAAGALTCTKLGARSALPDAMAVNDLLAGLGHA